MCCHLKKAIGILAVAAGVVVAGASAASANSGAVQVTNTCTGGTAKVLLHNNVAPKHAIDVISTIPNRPGFVGEHFDTTGASGDTVIWSKSWTHPQTGSVTLVIHTPEGGVEHSYSATLPAAGDCNPTTTVPQTTVPQTTTPTTEPPTSTSTIHTVSSTVTIEPTTTIPESSTTELCPTSGTCAPTTSHTDTPKKATPVASSGDLPRTGSSTVPLTLVGIVLAAGGAAFIASSRRKAIR